MLSNWYSQWNQYSLFGSGQTSYFSYITTLTVTFHFSTSLLPVFSFASDFLKVFFLHLFDCMLDTWYRLTLFWLTDCVNSHPDDFACDYWAGIGECTVNPAWMLPNCQRSCFSCSEHGKPVSTSGGDSPATWWSLSWTESYTLFPTFPYPYTVLLIPLD